MTDQPTVEGANWASFHDHVKVAVWDQLATDAAERVVSTVRAMQRRTRTQPKRPKRIAKKIARRYGHHTFAAARSADMGWTALCALSLAQLAGVSLARRMFPPR